jgi:uncharacterized membrane protein YedE/YeeE
MSNEFLMAAAGGGIIGMATVMLFWLNGRLAGISGIVNGVFSRTFADIGWRATFLFGLICGGLIFQALTGEALITRDDYPIGLSVAAGLLVGFGTRLGNGCTSGHGICGISRLSVRSVAATLTFIAVGMLVATTLNWFGGWGR